MIQSERKKGKNQNAETIHPFPPLRKGGGSSSRLIIGKFRPRLYTRFQLPARRSSSTFVNHRGYWDKRFLSAGMNRAHIAFARVKSCRPTRFLRHRRKRGPPTFYCVDEFFSPPFFPCRHGTPLPSPSPHPVSIIHRPLYQNLRSYPLSEGGGIESKSAAITTASRGAK